MENYEYWERIHKLELDVAVMQAKYIASQTELASQAVEYERRLHVLNGAHELAQQTLHTYVAQVPYDVQMGEFRSRVDKLERESSKRTGQTMVVGLVITIGLTLLPIVLRYV